MRLEGSETLHRLNTRYHPLFFDSVFLPFFLLIFPSSCTVPPSFLIHTNSLRRVKVSWLMCLERSESLHSLNTRNQLTSLSLLFFTSLKEKKEQNKEIGKTRGEEQEDEEERQKKRRRELEGSESFPSPEYSKSTHVVVFVLLCGPERKRKRKGGGGRREGAGRKKKEQKIGEVKEIELEEK